VPAVAAAVRRPVGQQQQQQQQQQRFGGMDAFMQLNSCHQQLDSNNR
jgi:hypothetical protein